MNSTDLSDVFRIAEDCGLGDGDAERLSKYQNGLVSPDALLFVASDEREILGFVEARLITTTVEIFNIGVSPQARRSGIGAALLQTVLQAARKKGATESWLEVRESNKIALKFYLAHNYKIVGKRKSYYTHPPENAILLTLTFSDGHPKK